MSVIGTYPCCGATLVIAVPEKTPAYIKEACPMCAALVWHRLSRVDPQSWTEADFLAKYEIDHEARTIKLKDEVRIAQYGECVPGEPGTVTS